MSLFMEIYSVRIHTQNGTRASYFLQHHIQYQKNVRKHIHQYRSHSPYNVILCL